ncbi:helix-turn-helix transcriptional regulator [Virgibacillus kimchii]
MIITLYVSETPYINAVLANLRKEKDFIVLSYDTYREVSMPFETVILADSTEVPLEELKNHEGNRIKVVAFIDRDEKTQSSLLLQDQIHSIFLKDECTLHTIAEKIRSIQDGYFFLPNADIQQLIGALNEEKRKKTELFVYQLMKRGIHFTRKQGQIVYFLRLGLKNTEIARILLITEESVRAHISHIYKKIGVNRRTQVIRLLNEMSGNMIEKQSVDAFTEKKPTSMT